MGTVEGLKLIDPYLSSQRCFSNHGEHPGAKMDLLRLWRGILRFVVACSDTKDKKVGYYYLLILMQRREFSLTRLGGGVGGGKKSNKKNDSSSSRSHQLQLHFCCMYQTELKATLSYIIEALEKPGCFEELVQFAAEALAIMFFRLPIVSSCITDALVLLSESTKGALEMEKEGGESFTMPTVRNDTTAFEVSSSSSDKGKDNTEKNLAERRRHARRSSTFDTGMRRVSTGQATEFIILNPDFYQWNDLPKDGREDGDDDDDEGGEEGRNRKRKDLEEKCRRVCKKWFAAKGRLGVEFFMTWTVFWVNHVMTVCEDSDEASGGALFANSSYESSGIPGLGSNRDVIVWSAIPAYNIILEAFFPLIYSATWWDANLVRKHGAALGSSYVSSFVSYTNVRQTASKLLENSKLVNALVEISFRCCNAYSMNSVESCVDHLHLWLQSAAYECTEEEKRLMAGTDTGNTDCTMDELTSTLPSTFDYDSFWKWTSVLLSSDSFQIVLKTLSFLYNALRLFHGEHRLRLVGDLLQEFFFPLFLHWSSDVRDFFHNLLVYKLVIKDRRYLPFFSDSRVMSLYGRSDLTWKIMAESEETRRKRHMELLSTPPEYHNESLLVDLAVVSKVDTYVRYCLEHAKESASTNSATAAEEKETRESGEDDAEKENKSNETSKKELLRSAAVKSNVPREGAVYVAHSLRNYSGHLQAYYCAAGEDRLSEVMPISLNHQMTGANY